MALYDLVLSSDEKPELNIYVPCIDYGKEWRIAKWDGEGWVSRDINSTESPPYRPIMSWLKTITYNNKSKKHE